MTSCVISLPSTARLRDFVLLSDEYRVTAVVVTHRLREDDLPEAVCRLQGSWGGLEQFWPRPEPKDPRYAAAAPGYYVVSHTNFVEFLADRIKEREAGDPLLAPLWEVMKGPLHLVAPETPIDRVIEHMAENGRKRVLVGEGGRPVGVLTTHDLLTWNHRYFKKAKPLFLMVVDQRSGVVIAKHVFEENLTEDYGVDEDLIDLFGGALKSIDVITGEVVKRPGQLRVMRGDRVTLLFEHEEPVTSVLGCDRNSIELRRRLHDWTKKFVEEFSSVFSSKSYEDYKPGALDISRMVGMFAPSKY
ncbi:MAG: hypothetical protein Kow0069_30290 [Promethearchaeota archaeon]